jgi:hypothetical protein
MRRRSLRLRIRQRWCALIRRHDASTLKTDCRRVWMRCSRCGHHTKGFRPGTPRYTRTQEAKPERQTWRRFRLNAQRRAA